MRLIIDNELSLLEFECKNCSKKYQINYEDVGVMPLWKFESCSRICALTYSKNKFLTLKTKDSNSPKFKRHTA